MNRPRRVPFRIYVLLGAVSLAAYDVGPTLGQGTYDPALYSGLEMASRSTVEVIGVE